MSDAYIDVFLNFRNLLKIYHWKTKSYARHIASDNLVKGIDGLIDQFMEVYFGKYEVNAKKLTRMKTTFELGDDDAFVDKELAFFKDIVIPEMKALLKPDADADLYNILDEMSALVNQTIYLFRLN